MAYSQMSFQMPTPLQCGLDAFYMEEVKGQSATEKQKQVCYYRGGTWLPIEGKREKRYERKDRNGCADVTEILGYPVRGKER